MVGSAIARRRQPRIGGHLGCVVEVPALGGLVEAVASDVNVSATSVEGLAIAPSVGDRKDIYFKIGCFSEVAGCI